MELKTTPFVPVLEPVSRPIQSSETTEPRAKQPRLGERVYPSSTPLSQRTTETAQQVGESVEGPEEEEEEMMLMTTVAPGPRSEGCLPAGARREIHPSSPEWSTPTGRELISKGVKVETAEASQEMPMTEVNVRLARTAVWHVAHVLLNALMQN